MAFKIYNKQGKHSYKEKKLISKLEPFLEKELAKDPNFFANWKPATNIEELNYYVNKYAIEEAVIVEEIPNSNKKQNNMSTENLETHTLSDDKKIDLSKTKTTLDNEPPKRDPFNRANPMERDYVTSGDGFIDENNSQKNNINFEEPQNSWDAYTIPDNLMGGDKTQPNQSNTNTQNTNQSQNNNSQKRQEPINPAFDSMSDAKKKRQTKIFAKGIVGVVCNLLEFGYVWWVTKDINESALFELEKSGVNLDILMTLSDGQEKTVRNFFAKVCEDATFNGKVTIDEREELADALADVLSEKGFAPTPMQTLISCGIGIVARLGISALQSRAETSSIILQLKSLKSEEDETRDLMTKEEDLISKTEIKNPPEATKTNSSASDTSEGSQTSSGKNELEGLGVAIEHVDPNK